MKTRQLFYIIFIFFISNGNCLHDDEKPFKCNEENRPRPPIQQGEFKQFLKLSGTPFNCADDITAYYEVEDCGEIDELSRKKYSNGRCRWKNGGRADCNELKFEDKNGKYNGSEGVQEFAYLPRNRGQCSAQYMHTFWDEINWKVMFRHFSAHQVTNNLSAYYLTTQRDDSTAKIREPMIDCGDQSNYKTFFYQAIHPSNECYFYKYTGPESKEGYEYEELNNCDNFSQFCRVYSNTSSGEVNEDCVPFNSFVEYSYQLVIRTTTGTNEQKKSCPKVIIRTSGKFSVNDPVEMRAYLAFEKEPQLSEISTKPTPTTGWASMKPSMNITRDYFGVMKQATIKFGLPPNNDVDIGRVESLKDLLKVITGPPKQGYQCNNPKELPNLLPEPFLRINGLPFNCKANQFQEYPLDSCNANDYELIGGRSGTRKACRIEEYPKNYRSRLNCEHFKICQHTEGQTDCKTTDKYKNVGLVSKAQQKSKCPNSLIMQDYRDENRKNIFRTYASLDNQEEYTGLAMDFSFNGSLSMRLNLQECGGYESYVMLRIYPKNSTHCTYYTYNNDLAYIFEDFKDCSLIQICENGECKGVMGTDHHGKVMIRVAKPKKDCPNVMIEKEPGYGKDVEPIHYISNNPETAVFEDDWSFLQPEVQYIKEDTFVNRVEIKFDSTARTIADKAKIGFLEEILNIILWE